METLLAALGPALAAGLAVQRLLEILDGPIERVVTSLFPKRKPVEQQGLKRLADNTIAIGIGFWLAFTLDLDILHTLGADTESTDAGFLDAIVTGLIVSTGTEGVNSIVKFLGYKKEEKKVQAGNLKAGLGTGEAAGASAAGDRQMDRATG